MEINFDKIKAFSAATFLQLICGVIVPGFLFLFIFKRDVFLSLDFFRLTTLAISITVPILIVNGIIVLISLINDNKEFQDDNAFHRAIASTIYIGSALTIPVIYIPIIIGYFFNLTLRQGILTFIIAEAILVITFILLYSLGGKSKKSPPLGK
jgi:hypothetical protein